MISASHQKDYLGTWCSSVHWWSTLQYLCRRRSRAADVSADGCPDNHIVAFTQSFQRNV